MAVVILAFDVYMGSYSRRDKVRSLLLLEMPLRRGALPFHKAKSSIQIV